MNRNFDTYFPLLRFVGVSSVALAILVTYIGLNSGAVERAATNEYLIDSLGWTAVMLLAPLTVWACYGVFGHAIATAPSKWEIEAKHSWWAERLERTLGLPSDTSFEAVNHLHRTFPKVGAVSVTAIIFLNLATDMIVVYRIGVPGQLFTTDLLVLAALSSAVAWFARLDPGDVTTRFVQAIAD